VQKLAFTITASAGHDTALPWGMG